MPQQSFPDLAHDRAGALASMHESLQAADHAECRGLLRNGSRTFQAASLLLPLAARQSATALYAFCRLADDAIDHGGGAQALWQWRERLHRIYAGRPLPIAADRAMAGVVARHAIPRQLPEALLEGFAWDTTGRQYEDLAALEAYAARVAGSVGAMMALLLGVRDSDAVARACDLGVAMQLSNIARDVGEDARAGRLYLPLAWLRQEGLDPAAWLAAPCACPAIKRVVQRLVTSADAIYARADAGIACLPARCRPGIRAARLLYAGIGHRATLRGHDAMTQRAVVPRRRKALLVLHALLPRARDAATLSLAPSAATLHLVGAVAANTARVSHPAPTPRAEWLLELFERLERREHFERSLAGD